MALIGVAFSLGFLFGPMIGAAFSVWGQGRVGDWFMYPAVLALILSILDIIFLSVCFKVGYHTMFCVLNVLTPGVPARE